jgi:hypothetical protein
MGNKLSADVQKHSNLTFHSWIYPGLRTDYEDMDLPSLPPLYPPLEDVAACRQVFSVPYF